MKPYEQKDDLILNGPVRQEAIGHSGTYQVGRENDVYILLYSAMFVYKF